MNIGIGLGLGSTGAILTPPVPPFDPLTVGPKVWLDYGTPTSLFQDIARSNPVTTNGQEILGMSDLSGNANHFKGTAGTGHIYITNAQNGKSVGRSSAGKKMQSVNVVTHNISGGAYYILMLVKYNAQNAAIGYNGLFSNGAYEPSYEIKNGSYVKMWWGSERTFNSSVPTAGNHILEIYRDEALNLRIKLDGVAATQVYNLTLGMNNQVLYLGTTTENGSSFLGDFMEFFLFNKLPTTTERSNLYTYLTQKWNPF